MLRPRVLPFLIVVLSFAETARATSFVVPTDARLIRNARAIVVASTLTSRVELTADEEIVTITTLSIHEVIKGSSITTGSTIEVREPGGVVEDRAVLIPGVPQFTAGERAILFLSPGDPNWHVLDLALGKFSLAIDADGTEVAVRDLDDVIVLGEDGTAHRERRRAAGPFLDYIRGVVRGGPVRDETYIVPEKPILGLTSTDSLVAKAEGGGLIPTSNATPTSYTSAFGDGRGGRWNVFPSPVTFYRLGTEPGAPNGGADAINAALGAWTNEPNSNVNLTFGGDDPGGVHNKGLSQSDGANVIAFERNLTARGIDRFQCSGNSYSGTLGIGGIFTSGTHTGPGGETFRTAIEGDVEMNQGIANCTVLFTTGNFNTAVAHEVGHALGFRHSDQNRTSTAACTSDPSLECSDLAVMRAVVPNGINAALQTWDRNAVSAVYPGASSLLPAPTGLTAAAITPTQVRVTFNAVTGATSYEILRRAPGTSFGVLGSTSLTTFTDTTASANTAYLYAVRVAGSTTQSTPDLATTVIFTDDPLVARSTVVKAVHLAELRTAANAVRALAGLGAFSFTDPASPGVIIKAIHITQLRAALDAALSALSLPAGGYTDPSLSGVVIKAVHFQELRDRVK